MSLTPVEAHPLYGVWRQMRMRCNLPSHPKYLRYGGRGIKVCERWDRSFAAFVEDVGERPLGMELDRKDNDGDYTPENVRWATRHQQQRNTGRSRYLTHGGETMTMADWAEKVGLPYATLNQRINGYGWSVEKALTTPKLTAGGKRVAS